MRGPVDTPSDTAFVFEITLTIHEDDEAEASKRLAKLLDEAERMGIHLVWKEPVYY